MKMNKTEAATKTPTHFAYQVRNREGKKAIWTSIDSAWAHADKLGSHPARGRADLRAPAEKDE